MSTQRTRAIARDPETHRVVDWGAVRCPNCGAEHDLAPGDSACGCGQLFNAGGQALVSRDQWEEPYEED